MCENLKLYGPRSLGTEFSCNVMFNIETLFLPQNALAYVVTFKNFLHPLGVALCLTWSYIHVDKEYFVCLHFHNQQKNPLFSYWKLYSCWVVSNKVLNNLFWRPGTQDSKFDDFEYFFSIYTFKESCLNFVLWQKASFLEGFKFFFCHVYYMSHNQWMCGMWGLG